MSALALLWTAIRPRPRGPKWYFVRLRPGETMMACLGVPDRTTWPAMDDKGCALAVALFGLVTVL